jgi:hypothetical protein
LISRVFFKQIANCTQHAMPHLHPHRTPQWYEVQCIGSIPHDAKPTVLTWSKGVSTGVTSGGKFGVVATRAKNERIFGRKRLLHQTELTSATLKALLMPVEVLVRHVFGVEA